MPAAVDGVQLGFTALQGGRVAALHGPVDAHRHQPGGLRHVLVVGAGDGGDGPPQGDQRACRARVLGVGMIEVEGVDLDRGVAGGGGVRSRGMGLDGPQRSEPPVTATR